MTRKRIILFIQILTIYLSKLEIFINIYLTDRDGNLNSFLDGRVTVTLHVSDPMIWETFKKNLIHTLINQNSMGEDFTKENRMQSL